ncbi:DUF6214 family protein [Streptomyces lasiicapitis]|uniref:DUF6214 family protein n=1 Tax=Streptomyces lasiicapitis TaxID=1923961 RepID=UPI003319282B
MEPAGLAGAAGLSGLSGLSGLTGFAGEWSVVGDWDEGWVEESWPTGENVVTVPRPASDVPGAAGAAWSEGSEGAWAESVVGDRDDWAEPDDEGEWVPSPVSAHGGAEAEPTEGPRGDWADPEVTGQGGALFHVRLAFDESGRRDVPGGGCCPNGGGGADVLASVSDGRITIEELRAQPPLPLAGLAALAARIEGPLNDAARGLAEQDEAGFGGAESGCRGGGSPVQEPPAPRRGRPSARRGSAVRHVTAEAYRGALDDGEDPVLAVMRATGHSRRKSLRLIAGARDAGLLMPRHHRR